MNKIILVWMLYKKEGKAMESKTKKKMNVMNYL